jgi:hypothetical protein
MQAAPMQAAPQDVGALIQEYFDAPKGTDEDKSWPIVRMTLCSSFPLEHSTA